jgi:hypothetical protein
MHRSHVVYSDDLTDRSLAGKSPKFLVRMCALRAPGAQANFESNASKILVGRANSVGGGCALRQHMGAVGDSSNLNPAGQDTREQTTKRTAHERTGRHEGTHTRRRTPAQTNQPTSSWDRVLCRKDLLYRGSDGKNTCSYKSQLRNQHKLLESPNNAPTRQKVAEDRERAAGPRARADP